MATPEQSNGLRQTWAALRRRRLPVLLTFAIVAVGAIVAAIVWPPTYSSTGTILIEQQELPSDLVRSTVSTYAAQRVQVIAQRVMTTENLMGIIERYNLYADLRKRKPREEIIAKMRRATDLQMISADVIDPRDGRPTKATIAFSLTYSNSSPQLAAQVANELVSLYLQQNIETRQKSAQDAVNFLSGEGSRLSRDIDSLQQKIAAFKAQNADDLPELAQLNLATLNRTEDDILEANSELESKRQQLLYLDAQLAQVNPTSQIYTSTGERVQSPQDLLKALRSEYARDVALYAPDYPDVVQLKREIASLEGQHGGVKQDPLNDERRQLEDAQAELDAAKHRYAADHPDVVRLQKVVDALQQKVAATSGPTKSGATVAPKTTASTVASSASASSSAGASSLGLAASDPNPDADNPTYIQLRAQREAVASEMKALQDKLDKFRGKQSDYERRLAKEPGVEREYTQMIRDLAATQAQYTEIRSKQMTADISDNMETERKGERFTLIEPPLVPEEPTSPNRPLLIILGFVAALGVAFGLVATLEAVDGSVRSRQDLHQLVQVPPLAIIPLMLTRADYALRRRRRWYALASTFGCIAVGLLAVHLFYRPLDVLWAVALRQLGIQS